VTNKQEFFVQASGSAYTTNTVRGCRASSTSSANMAAERMGEKLFGASLSRVEKAADENQFTTRWTAHAQEEEWASVDANGLLDFGPVIPVSNTAVAKGPAIGLRVVVCTQASWTDGARRHERFAFVPDIAAAQGRDEKDRVLLEWLHRSARLTRPKDSLGVVFETRIRRSEMAAW